MEQDHAASRESRFSRTKSRVSGTFSGAGQRGRSAYENASRSARDGLHKMEDSFQSRPLAFAGGAFCIGLVLGLAIPTLRREQRALRPYASKLREAGREAAEMAEERAHDAAVAAEEALMGDEQKEQNASEDRPEEQK